MKRKYTGMTLIEILMVAGIVIVLAGLLIPAMTQVRKVANQTKQRAELSTIELAVTTFKNDYGDYPPSNRDSSCEVGTNDYSGAQKLAEALCGWDLLGFHPDSRWRSDGRNCDGSVEIYRRPLDPANNAADLQNLRERRGPYLDIAKISVFKLGSLFNSRTGEGVTLEDTYVLCDVFGVRNAQVNGKNVKAGTPILYYKANPASKIHSTGNYDTRIYNVDDNRYLAALKLLTPDGSLSNRDHRISDSTNQHKNFYDFITDGRVTIPGGWPYKADSYILISAGADGEYGTKDDICNF